MDTSQPEPTLLGRAVFGGQWLVALLVPVLLFGGRGWLGAPTGWLTGVGMLSFAPPAFLLLGSLPLVLATDTVSLPRRCAPVGYARASIVLWVAVAGLIVTVVDPEVAGSSLLSTWTGGSVSDDLSSQLAGASGLAAALSWLVAMGLAVGSVISNRARRPD